MATRNVTYQFDWGFATYDRQTEQTYIAQIEAEGVYIDKFDVTIQERALIDGGDVIYDIDGNNLNVIEADS